MLPPYIPGLPRWQCAACLQSQIWTDCMSKNLSILPPPLSTHSIHLHNCSLLVSGNLTILQQLQDVAGKTLQTWNFSVKYFPQCTWWGMSTSSFVFIFTIQHIPFTHCQLHDVVSLPLLAVTSTDEITRSESCKFLKFHTPLLASMTKCYHSHDLLWICTSAIIVSSMYCICCFLVFLFTIKAVIITHKWWLEFYNWRLNFYHSRMYVLIYTLSTTADTWFFIIFHTPGYTSQSVFSKKHAYTNIIKICVINCNSYKKNWRWGELKSVQTLWTKVFPNTVIKKLWLTQESIFDHLLLRQTLCNRNDTEPLWLLCTRLLTITKHTMRWKYHMCECSSTNIHNSLSTNFRPKCGY